MFERTSVGVGWLSGGRVDFNSRLAELIHAPVGVACERVDIDRGWLRPEVSDNVGSVSGENTVSTCGVGGPGREEERKEEDEEDHLGWRMSVDDHGEPVGDTKQSFIARRHEGDGHKGNIMNLPTTN